MSGLGAAPRDVKLAALKARLGALDSGKTGKFQPLAPDSARPELADGTLTELVPDAYFETPAAFAFFAGLAAQAAARRPGPILLALRAAGLDFGLPDPAGLAAAGAPAERVILVRARTSKEALWALEEGARTPGLALAAAAGVDEAAWGLTPSRRVGLAVEKSGVPALVLRPAGARAPSAARARWRICAAPGAPAPWRGAAGLPGLTARRWAVRPDRTAGAGAWFEVAWNETALCFDPPAALVRGPGAATAEAA